MALPEAVTDDWWRSLPDGKRISALGFGCSSLWAKRDFDEDLAQEILHVAAEGGINHFDTAPSYGAGLGEARLGRYLAGVDHSAQVISTKIGTNLINGDVQRGFDIASIERSFEGSLKRLGLSRVDVLYLHGPPRDALVPKLFDFFGEQKAAGRIGLAGIESGDTSIFAQAIDLPIDVAMLHYNISDHSTGPLIDSLAAKGKTIVSGTVLAQGKFDLKTYLPTNRRKLWYLLRQMKNDRMFWRNGPRLARRMAKLPGSAHENAIGFVVGNRAITSGLFGSSNVAHVRQNAVAGHRPLGVAAQRYLASGQ